MYFLQVYFFDAAYGFNQFSNVYNDELFTYGKDWNFISECSLDLISNRSKNVMNII
ncbi:MAG: hypothetical protein IPL53_21960 [Ignavibacteria bacterium]|nr:hypothetical protein [Ignavibacteria bacterium]